MDINTIQSAKQTDGILVAPRGKTGWNAVFRFGAQFVSILLNLVATPYIIRNLGVESYGVVGVINTMISFMAIATTSLIATVGRNLTFAVEQQEYEKANKEISTAVYGLLRLFAISFLPLLALSIFIEKLIIMPPEVVVDARILYLLAVVAFGFTTISGPLGAAMFVRNRLDLFSGTSLARTVFFLALIVVLFSTVGANLTTYAIALLAGSILICFLHLRIHRHLLPGIEISMQWFDRSILREIIALGGWMTVAQIGGLLFLQTDLLVANRVLGATAAGQLAAISVISLQLRSLASLVSGLFAPNQAALWARGDQPAFSRYLLRSIRITTLFMALLVGIFCGSAEEILSLWLGQEFVSLTPVALLLTSYLVISLGILPSWNAALAIGRVKVPAVVTLFLGVVNVLLSIILANKMGLMGIALSGCIMLTLRNTLFTPWYISRVCNISFWAFWRELGYGTVYSVVFYLISITMNRLIVPDSLFQLAGSLTLSGAICLLLLFPIALRELRQRSQIRS
ncbi:MAG: polysaccharide biosynthesis C-terminal domain-containing protein [Nitrospirae bacterium]|nr:polysaccharide biosynthesis C-terminal domain-containing protein [Nitrospirota bacterium]